MVGSTYILRINPIPSVAIQPLIKQLLIVVIEEMYNFPTSKRLRPRLYLFRVFNAQKREILFQNKNFSRQVCYDTKLNLIIVYSYFLYSLANFSKLLTSILVLISQDICRVFGLIPSPLTYIIFPYT